MTNHDDNIRPHIRALIERGNIAPEEYRNLRLNSWEWEAVVPALSLETLIETAERAIVNCKRVRSRSTAEVVYSVYAPELIRRLKALNTVAGMSDAALAAYVAARKARSENTPPKLEDTDDMPRPGAEELFYDPGNGQWFRGKRVIG